MWDLDDHTEKKHVLLGRYLSRWVPIFQHGHGKTDNLVFVDGFAGPGIYSGGQPGSPVVMLKTYLNAQRQPDTVLHCFFVEQSPKRHEELERQIEGFRSDKIKIETFLGDYSEHYETIKSRIATLGKSTAVFAFLDPFGGVEDPDMAVEMTVRSRSEALVYLPVGMFGARFLENPNMQRTLTAIFGDERWRVLVGKTPAERTLGLMDLYEARLKEGGPGAPRFYVERFMMRPGNPGANRYCLFFATKHRRAVEAMRDAMWHVDPANGRQFDPREPSDPGLELWKPELAARLRERFPNGTTFDFDDAWQYVVDEVPPFDKKRLTAVLKHLRDDTKQLVAVRRADGKPHRRGFNPKTTDCKMVA
ncbi:three-Cys-motif partner protein TcmP [Baekduia sp. Peel2402]|uniref:three-Cys-motif partner protein TcmP n=1 Tax=Baekduia sp. Peel2402 TaxID=3458296 RepID=UPI00403E8464